MVLAFGPSEELRHIVVAQAFCQTHRPGLRSVGLGRRRLKHLLQPNPQGVIHNLFERLAETGRTLSCLGRNIGIESEGRAHNGIMMLN